MKLKIGKKTGLKRFGIEDIRSWGPCYDPKKFIPEEWRGTAVDILRMGTVPIEDRLWVVLRTDITSERVMRLFAVWCARQVQHLMEDTRSVAALDVAERFAVGAATQGELDAAWAAAWAAARAAAWATARDSARDSAWAAARATARAAAWATARAAAWAAARDSAWATARTTAQDSQVTKLIEMLEAEGRERKAQKGPQI